MKDKYTDEEVITKMIHNHYGHYGPLDSPKFIQQLSEIEYDIRISALVSDSRPFRSFIPECERECDVFHTIDIPFDSKQDGLTKIDNLLKNVKKHQHISLCITQYVKDELKV